MLVYGRIRSFDEKTRVLSILRKNRISYFYVSRTQIKKYSPYLAEGLYVYFKASNERKKHHSVFSYDVISFIKIMRSTARKTYIYYDQDTIKEGVVNLLNQEHNRMFLDLEFTMPPYNFSKSTNKKEFTPEIIQYGIYVENKNGELLDCDTALVKPTQTIGLNSRTYSFLNITPHHMRKAISYTEFYNNFKYFMETYNPVIYVWGKNDMSVIDKSYKIHEKKPITKRKDFINLMQVIKNYYSIKDDIGLFKAVDWLENKESKEEQEHDALDDAFMTMKVFHLFKKRITTENNKLNTFPRHKKDQ